MTGVPPTSESGNEVEGLVPAQWYLDLKRKNQELLTRAEYLQHEINEMRRVMQDAGTWEKFCADYAAYKERNRA